MNGEQDPAAVRAEIEQIEHASAWIQRALWVIAGGSLIWTAATVTQLAVSHGTPPQIAWVLSPLVECALIAVLLGDGILSTYGIRASRWAVLLRWFAGLSAWLMNVWASLGLHGTHRPSPDAASLLIHSIVPALLILLAEVAPRYRRQFAVIAERLRNRLQELEPNAVQVPAGEVRMVRPSSAPAVQVPPVRNLPTICSRSVRSHPNLNQRLANPKPNQPAAEPEPHPTPEPTVKADQRVQVRTSPTRTSAPNLGDRSEKKVQEIRQVLNLIEELGPGAVKIDDVRNRFGLTKTTAHQRLTAARQLWNQRAVS